MVCKAQDITIFVFWFLLLFCEICLGKYPVFSSWRRCPYSSSVLYPRLLVSHSVTQNQIFLWKEAQPMLLLYFINDACRGMTCNDM